MQSHQPRRSTEKSRSRDNSREPQQYNQFYQQQSSHIEQRNQEQKKKVHLSNLPLSITEDEIRAEIEQLHFGLVEDIKIIKKNSSGQQLNNTYYAFVQMASQDEAENLLANFEKYSNKNWLVKTSKEKQNKGEYIKRDQNQFMHGHNQYSHHQNQNQQHQQNQQNQQQQQQQSYNFSQSRQYSQNNNQQQQQQSQQFQNHKFHNRNFNQQKQQQWQHQQQQQQQQQQQLLQPTQDQFFVPQQFQQQQQLNRGIPQQTQQILPLQTQQQIAPAYQQQQQFGNQAGNQRFQPQQQYITNQTKFQDMNKHYFMKHDHQQFEQNQSDDMDMMSQLLNMPSEQLEEYNKNMSNPLSNQILVRELWIGNIPKHITQKYLETNLKSFGELESVDFFDKGPVPFAFAKYRRVADASKAFEQQGTLQALLECSSLKISFSDHQRRINIVGDSYNYEKPEDLSSTVYIGYNTGSMIPSEHELHEEFSKYVKEQAKKLYKKYMRDHHGDRRARIGDRKCEFSIQTKPKQRVQRNKIPQQISNEQQQQQQQQITMDQFVQHSGQRKEIAHQGQQQQYIPAGQQQFEQRKFQNQFQPQQQQQQQQQMPYFQKTQHQQGMMGGQLIQKKFQQQQGRGGYNEVGDQQQGKLFSQLDYLTQLLEHESGNQQQQQEQQQVQQQIAQEVIQDFSQQSPIEMDNTFWSGFITRSKKNRVGVDATLIYGKDLTLTEYNLNINFRTQFQEILKHKVIAVCLFMPSNSTQNQLFTEYKKYFQEKNRAGVVQMQKYMVYIIPTGIQEVEEIINVGNDGMLGVFTEVDLARENPNGETLVDVGRKLKEKQRPPQIQPMQPIQNYQIYQQQQHHQQSILMEQQQVQQQQQQIAQSQQQQQIQQQQQYPSVQNQEQLEKELNDVLPMLDNPEILNILNSNMF